MSTQVVEKIYQTYDSIESIIYDKIDSNTQERSFYVADMNDIYKKFLIWQKLMPRVKPFYAVKCNNLPEIVSLLASLGTNFDCASKQEIQQVLSLGVSPDKIIYANPCKTNAFIRHAKNVKVDLMTFDNELELHKVAQLHPNAKLVLRIKGDEQSSRCKFNMKFGADIDKCYHLFKVAKQLELQVVGVSFHNGSDCSDTHSYEKSIAACRLIFDMGIEIGHDMYLLDIGGGFPGDTTAKISFELIAETINKCLDMYFPANSNEKLEVIAEPGRYFVSSSMTLCCMVIAKRPEYDEKSGRDGFMYYLNDGVYGGFNNVIFEHAQPVPEIIPSRSKSLKKFENGKNGSDDDDDDDSSSSDNSDSEIEFDHDDDETNINSNNQRNVNQNHTDQDTEKERKLYTSVMWGPTCDSIDCIKRDFLFPELEVGQWLMFKNMGAYTCCTATTFNGFELATVLIADPPQC